MKKIDELYMELDEMENTVACIDILLMLVTAIESYVTICAIQHNIYDKFMLVTSIIEMSLMVAVWTITRAQVKYIEKEIDDETYEMTETSDL